MFPKFGQYVAEHSVYDKIIQQTTLNINIWTYWWVHTFFYHTMNWFKNTIKSSASCQNVKLTLVWQTCICTDWQLTNSTDETRLSKTTEDLRHESRNTEFNFPFTVSVESRQLNMYTTLFISTLSSITREWLPWWCSCNIQRIKQKWNDTCIHGNQIWFIQFLK